MIQRPAAALIGLLAAATAADAARIDARDLTCAEAQRLVAEEGAVVMAVSTFLFYRYVSDRGQCDRTQIIRAATAPTADNPRCAVGYRCASRPGSSP